MNATASLRRWLYLGPARKAARGLGIGRLRVAFSQIRTAIYRWKYATAPEETVRVEARGVAAEFRASSAIEFAKYKSIGGEKQFLTALLALIQPGDVVYDIGANVGVFTVFFAKRIGERGKLLAFEPEDKAYRRLLENIQVNRLSNVQAHQLALGNESGSITLYADSDAASGVHSAVRPPGGRIESTAQMIRVMAGDEFAAQSKLPVANVIKLDVEGMEYEALKGLERTLATAECRVVVCEVHFSILESRGMAQAPRAIENLLERSGFRIEWRDASHLIAKKEPAACRR